MTRRRRNKNRRGPGRPRKANARRRETTRAGRAGTAIADLGTLELRLRRILTTGTTELPADSLGVLLGHRLITNIQYLAGRDVGELLADASSGLAANNSVHSAWRRIFTGLVSASASADVSAAAERAWRILRRLRSRLGDERMAELVFAIADGGWRPFLDHAIGRCLTAEDFAELRLLNLGLDRVARTWSSGRDSAKTA